MIKAEIVLRFNELKKKREKLSEQIASATKELPPNQLAKIKSQLLATDQNIQLLLEQNPELRDPQFFNHAATDQIPLYSPKVSFSVPPDSALAKKSEKRKAVPRINPAKYNSDEIKARTNPYYMAGYQRFIADEIRKIFGCSIDKIKDGSVREKAEYMFEQATSANQGIIDKRNLDKIIFKKPEDFVALAKVNYKIQVCTNNYRLAHIDAQRQIQPESFDKILMQAKTRSLHEDNALQLKKLNAVLAKHAGKKFLPAPITWLKSLATAGLDKIKQQVGLDTTSKNHPTLIKPKK